MKKIVFAGAICIAFVLAGPGPAASEQGYTVIMTERGPQVCVGAWIPPRDVGLAGECQGQIMSFQQFSAISARQSADALNQLAPALSAIDQKMAVTNEQMSRLIEATVNTQAAIERQVNQVSEFLGETITEKFRAIPEELLADERFKKELTKIKKEILEEVEKRYPPAQRTPAK